MRQRTPVSSPGRRPFPHRGSDGTTTAPRHDARTRSSEARHETTRARARSGAAQGATNSPSSASRPPHTLTVGPLRRTGRPNIDADAPSGSTAHPHTRDSAFARSRVPPRLNARDDQRVHFGDSSRRRGQRPHPHPFAAAATRAARPRTGIDGARLGRAIGARRAARKVTIRCSISTPLTHGHMAATGQP